MTVDHDAACRGGRRLALAHDWLTGMRGGERVLELLCREFPAAPVHTLLCNRRAISPAITAHPIHTSRLQRIPGIERHYRYWLPFFPVVARDLRPADCELLISTSHCVAKSAPKPPGARHLCYCFTPMRYAWGFFNEYIGPSPLKQTLARPVLRRLRAWDRRTAAGVDRFVAISDHIRKRIRRCYGRESDLVYPPVDTAFYTPGAEPPGDYDLIVSALVPYKRIDLAVEVYNRSGRPLTIVGVGSEIRRLRAAAAGNVRFLGWQTDETIRDLYRRCRCLVFPGEEDFGIVPVEVQACGRPVVAFNRGGARETVAAGETGVFFDEQTAGALRAAVERCHAADWDGAVIRRHAERFSERRFLEELRASIGRVLDERE